jgi:hypothetical protein
MRSVRRRRELTPKPEPPTGRLLQKITAEDLLLLDGPAELSEMLAKSVVGIGRAFGEIFGEAQLSAKGCAGSNSVSLGAFALPDGFRGFQDFFGRSGVDKDAAVVIGENEVAILHFEIAEARRPKRAAIAWIEALRAGGAQAVTPNRKADLSQLRGVAMRSPDDDGGEARRSCFECGQVADATFVAPAGIIDHKNVAGLRVFHRFEEDIHAAEMFRRKDTARRAHPGSDRDDPGWGNPDRKFQTHGRIKHEWRGQLSELLRQRLVLHE